MILGLDLANFTPVPTKANLDAWWLAGIRFVIVGCQKDQAAHAQLQALTADGRFHLEAYVYLVFDGADEQRIQRAFKLCDDFGIKRIWLDVEESNTMPPAEVVKSLHKYVAMVEAHESQTVT